MSRSGRSALSLLQRCVAAARQPLSPACAAGVPASSGAGLVQRRTWTSGIWTSRHAQGLCRLQSAARRAQVSLCTKAGPPQEEDEYPPLPTYEATSDSAKDGLHIVRVKGIPWSTSTHDLLHFFSECRIRNGMKGVHMYGDRQGRTSGAFIEMEDEEDVRKALEKHRQYLGHRYVEVSEVTNGEVETLLQTHLQPPADITVVRLRGLPYSCTKLEVTQFFSGLDIVEDGVTMVTDHIGRNTGNAFVQFSSVGAATEALKKDREIMGNRYVEVFPSSQGEIYSRRPKRERSSAQSGPNPVSKAFSAQLAGHRNGPPHRASGSLHCVHMRGLPFQASGVDIVKFFSPLQVTRIQIEHGSNGLPLGEADVYFDSHQDAVEALSKDRQYIGERYVELFLNSTPEEER